MAYSIQSAVPVPRAAPSPPKQPQTESCCGVAGSDSGSPLYGPVHVHYNRTQHPALNTRISIESQIPNAKCETRKLPVCAYMPIVHPDPVCAGGWWPGGLERSQPAALGPAQGRAPLREHPGAGSCCVAYSLELCLLLLLLRTRPGSLLLICAPRCTFARLPVAYCAFDLSMSVLSVNNTGNAPQYDG
jgi:hypothetical protein